MVAQHIEEAGLQDAAIVAHSKGGLIGKYTMLMLDPEQRIDRMITVCTPFSGSRYARYMLLPTLRIFSPRNALTLELAREEAINSRITSVYGPFDPHIPEGSVLPGATNIELPTAGHFRILGDPETARIIVEQLNPDEP
jgi:pimeloyl-ACP methyl ester carboxylesterase